MRAHETERRNGRDRRVLGFGLIIGVVFVVVFGYPEIALADANPEAVPTERSAGPADVNRLDRWTPALGFFGGLLQQNVIGTIRTSDVLGPQCSPNLQCLSNGKINRGGVGQDQLRGFRAGVSAELMTPRLVAGFGHPRLFAHVDPTWIVGFERRVAGNGTPAVMRLSGLVNPNVDPEEAAFTGQGARISANIRSFMINAGIGMAFTFEAFETTFRVKPSFEYLQDKLTVTGRVNRTVQVAANPMDTSPGNFRFIELSAISKKTYHAIGPGLEVETDASRVGSFTVSPFIAGRAYYFLGNLDVSLRAQNEFSETASVEFTRDQWQWDGRVGVRFRWDPR